MLAPLALKEPARSSTLSVRLHLGSFLLTKSELVHARHAVVDAACSLLESRADFFEAVRTIARHAYALDPDMKDDELWGFMSIDSQTDHLASVQSWRSGTPPSLSRSAPRS